MHRSIVSHAASALRQASASPSPSTATTRSSYTTLQNATSLQRRKFLTVPSRSGSTVARVTPSSCRKSHSSLAGPSFSAALSWSSRAPAASRLFSSTASLGHGGKGRPAPGTGIKVTFKNHKGELIKEVEANEGDDIVDLSWEYDLDIEAACEKSIACSTCHVILDQDSYDKLPEPSDEENDMLDMAFGLEDTSRLGCQCQVTREMDGMVISLPSASRNFAVDGHKSKH